MMYGNIENGVIEGYLVPVGGGTADGSKDGTDSVPAQTTAKRQTKTRVSPGKRQAVPM